jgi:hypothetical protein
MTYWISLGLLLLERSPRRSRARVATLARGLLTSLSITAADEDRSEIGRVRRRLTQGQSWASRRAPRDGGEHYANAGGLSSGLQMSVYMIVSAEFSSSLVTSRGLCVDTGVGRRRSPWGD